MILEEPPTVSQPQAVTIELPRFGPFTYSVEDVIEFPWGLPGFFPLRYWIAINLDEEPSFIWLQSLDDLSIAIPTANPWGIFEEYDPQLPAYAVTTLEIAGSADFTMLGVVVAGENAHEFTMNLLAPIVINVKKRRGRQIMLDGARYSAREPIPRKAPVDAIERGA